MLLLQLQILGIRKYHRNEFRINEELINVFLENHSLSYSITRAGTQSLGADDFFYNRFMQSVYII